MFHTSFQMHKHRHKKITFVAVENWPHDPIGNFLWTTTNFYTKDATNFTLQEEMWKILHNFLYQHKKVTYVRMLNWRNGGFSPFQNSNLHITHDLMPTLIPSLISPPIKPPSFSLFLPTKCTESMSHQNTSHQNDTWRKGERYWIW